MVGLFRTLIFFETSLNQHNQLGSWSDRDRPQCLPDGLGIGGIGDGLILSGQGMVDSTPLLRWNVFADSVSWTF